MAEKNIHFHGNVQNIHIQGERNPGTSPMRPLQNPASSNASRPNVITLRTKKQQDGIKELLPDCVQGSRASRKAYVMGGSEPVIWCKELLSSNDKSKTFKLGFSKRLLHNVNHLICILMNCSPPGTKSDSLVHISCSVEGINHNGCRSSYLRPQDSCVVTLCPLEQIPDVFNVSYTLYSGSVSPGDMISNQPLNFLAIAAEHEQIEKMYSLDVSWTLDSKNYLGCVIGERVHSAMFGDAEEKIVLCAILAPIGDSLNPSGNVVVNIYMLHLPCSRRESGLEIKYKLALNGFAAPEATNLFKEGQRFGNEFSALSNYKGKKLQIDVHLEFDLK